MTNRAKMTNCTFQYDWDELGFQEAGAAADVSAGHLIQGKYKMASLYQVGKHVFTHLIVNKMQKSTARLS